VGLAASDCLYVGAHARGLFDPTMRFQTLSHPSKVVWFDPALVNSVNIASRLLARIVEYATALAVNKMSD